VVAAQKTEQEDTFDGLDHAWENAFHISDFDASQDRYVIFSDLHKGDKKGRSDDFSQNELIYCHALQWYLERDYRLILNGDAEELWEADPGAIAKAYKDSAFEMERQFASQPGRYHRIYGNHDLDWKDEGLVKEHLWPLLGQIKVYPAVRLGERIFIVHGHQGDPHSDQGSRFSRFLVRLVWRPLQDIGLTDVLWEPLAAVGLVRSSRAAQNNLIRLNRDRYMYQWAQKKRLLLIAGHTHRAIFRSFAKTHQLKKVQDGLKKQLAANTDPDMRYQLKASIRYLDEEIKKSKEERKLEKGKSHIEDNPAPSYFNSGCCVYTTGITGIEIDRGQIRLVKWSISDTFCDVDGMRRHPSLFASIERKVYESGDLKEILGKI
jgi:UDP-2,3-diacylglucosamine pyrophosphatase LpxH